MNPIIIVLCIIGASGLILFLPFKGARSRKAPGLLDNQARYFHTGTFAAAKANFEVIDFPDRTTLHFCHLCKKCARVCPFSHPDDEFHHFIRWGIKNNLLFRHLAIKLDDLFYGRKPAIRPLPDWSDILEKP